MLLKAAQLLKEAETSNDQSKTLVGECKNDDEHMPEELQVFNIDSRLNEIAIEISLLKTSEAHENLKKPRSSLKASGGDGRHAERLE